MSVGPLGGLIGSAAGAPYAQTQGAESDRALHEANNQQRQVKNEKKAEKAAGVGETDGEDTFASDRDADGRKIWEGPEEQRPPSDADDNAEHAKRRAKDATGDAGTQLDLTA